MSLPPHNPPNLLDALRNALMGDDPVPPYRNALTRLHREPEVAEELRRYVAWANAGGGPGVVWLRDQDGLLMHWDEYGQYSEYGWHVHRMHDGALGGRYTRDNIVARHWRGNTGDGGSLGAFLRRR